MLKITAMLSLMFIVSSVWSECDSCGSECVRACGTRRFRPCCFNYLRKKRGPEVFKIHSLSQNVKDSQPRSGERVFVLENNIPMAKQWTADELSSENHPYSLEDILENNLD